MTEDEALARLRASEPITYDELLDEVFAAFGFASEFQVPDVTWYRHPAHDCGEFRAQPRYEFSVLSETQRWIVVRMVECVRQRRHLER